jgi:hypothetical protein
MLGVAACALVQTTAHAVGTRTQTFGLHHFRLCFQYPTKPFWLWMSTFRQNVLSALISLTYPVDKHAT